MMSLLLFVSVASLLALVGALIVSLRAGRTLLRQVEETDAASCEWPLLFQRTLPSHQWW